PPGSGLSRANSGPWSGWKAGCTWSRSIEQTARHELTQRSTRPSHPRLAGFRGEGVTGPPGRPSTRQGDTVSQRHSIEDVEKHGRQLHQGFAAQAANLREWGEREVKAVQEMADAASALAVAEGQLDSAKATDAKAARATFAKAADR